MPESTTFDAGALDEFEPGRARRIVADGRKLCLVRLADEVHAIGDTCSHADVSLSEGEVWADGCEIECPKHGSTFSLRSGEPQSLPATQPVPVYPVTLVEGRVHVVLRPLRAPANEEER